MPSSGHPSVEDYLNPNQLRALGIQRGVASLAAGPSRRPPPTPSAIEQVVPGAVVDTPAGPCYVTETRFPMQHLLGSARIADLPIHGCPSPFLARVCGDARLSEQDYRSAVFLDIETTGLGMGVGLVAFLVGLGTFEQDGFCVRQYFLRDYGEENALLYLLAQLLQGPDWWISFNGRAFDLPVLQARFTCAQQAMPLAEAPHLDLLPPARKLWRKRLASCRLTSLENGVLGLARQDDVPGYLVPELYFDYLRYGDATALRGVFYHNVMDIVSLVGLAAIIDQTFRDPLCPPQQAIDLYSVALVCESQQEWTQATALYARAIEDGLPTDLLQDAMLRLSMLHKRTGEMEQAVSLWQSLRGMKCVQADVELAKYFERHEHDPSAAAQVIAEALLTPNLPASGHLSAAALKERMGRLFAKLGRGEFPMAHIESYSFGHLTVDGKTYTSDLIILPGGIHADWRRKRGHSLHSDDLETIVQAAPKVLVVGTGSLGQMKVSKATLAYLAGKGIRVVVERTGLACQRYNELAADEPTAAAFHLTC